MITRTSEKPFGFKDKLGYLFGDFGNDFTFILSSSFLLNGAYLRQKQTDEARKIQAVDSPHVRARGNFLFPYLPKRTCGHVYGV